VEHWYLLSGEAADIPRGVAHRLRNTGKIEVAFIEVQTGGIF
jgi:mannose-6-phosphate isomerase-like protein (cupin superfamily)